MQDENREEQTPVPGTEPAASPVQPPAEPEEVVSWYVRPDRAREVQDCYVQPRPMPAAAIPKAEPEKKPHSRRGLWIFLIVLAVLVGTVLGVAVVTALRSGEPSDGGYDGGEDASSIVDIFGGDIPTIPRADIDPSVRFYCQDAAEEKLTIQQVYAAVNPATVLVVAEMGEKASIGTGVILTEDGYIVTNHHVVADADEGTVVVQFYSGEEYPAAIVGTDSMNDIALLKIEAEGLQTVTVGDSDEVEVGETVEAIGNPLGDLTFTMTAGYISALDREIDADGTPINMLQTDAAINSGNSGGPLFDMNGNIIGVTTAKVSGTTETGVTIEGLGFAIPINDVLRVVYDLQQYGRVRGRAYLGVTLQNLDAEVAEIYGLPSGPQVVTVTEGSCSEKAGLQPHDIILEFDGREINAYSDLVSALSKHRAGDTVKLKLYRAGAEIEVTLTLDERPGEEEINEAEQQAQNELEGQSGQEEEFTVPDFDGYGYDYGG